MEIGKTNTESSQDLAATVSLPVDFTRSLAAVLNPFLAKAIPATTDSTKAETVENKPEAITHQADSAVQSQKTAESPLKAFLNYFGVNTTPTSTETAVEADAPTKTETPKAESSEKTKAETPSMWSSIRKAVLSGIPGGTIINLVVDAIPKPIDSNPVPESQIGKSWYQSLLEDPLGTMGKAAKNILSGFNLPELTDNVSKGFTKLGDWLDSFDLGSNQSTLFAKQELERKAIAEEGIRRDEQERYWAQESQKRADEQKIYIEEAARIRHAEEIAQDERNKEINNQSINAKELVKAEVTELFKQIASSAGVSTASFSTAFINSTEDLIGLMLESAKSSSPTKYAELLSSLKHQSAFSNLISRTLSNGEGLAQVKELIDSNHGTDFIA